MHSPDKVLTKITQPEVCLTCHTQQRAEINRTFRHPILEGKVVCSDCHNPHGSIGRALMKRDDVRDTCFQCHAEKRGPFVHEHEPVTSDCTLCHNPHGTVADSMLKMRPPFPVPPVPHAARRQRSAVERPEPGIGEVRAIAQPHDGWQERHQLYAGPGLPELPYADSWQQQPELYQPDPAVLVPLRKGDRS